MIIVTVGLVILAYIMLMMLRPFIGDAVETANASANWTNFPGGQEAIVGFPYWAYFIPAGIGLVAVVGILRS